MLLFLHTLAFADKYSYDENTRNMSIYSNSAYADGKELKKYIDINIIRYLTITGSTGKLSDGFMSGSQNLLSVTFDGATSLSDDAFYECRKLTRFRLPKGLKRIGDSSLSRTAIKKVVIPEGWESIDNYAFYFSSLEEVVFEDPSSEYPTVGSSAFYTSSLKRVVYCGTKKVDANYRQIFPTHLKANSIFVSPSYAGKQFLGMGFTKHSNVPAYCAAIDDDWFNDTLPNITVVSSKIYDEFKCYSIKFVAIALAAILVLEIFCYWFAICGRYWCCFTDALMPGDQNKV